MNLFKAVCALGILIFVRSYASETKIQESLSLKQKSNSTQYEATTTFVVRTITTQEASLFVTIKKSIFDINLPTIQYPSGIDRIAYLMRVKEMQEWGVNRKWIYHDSMKYPSIPLFKLFLRQHPLTLCDQTLCFVAETFDRQDPLLDSLPKNLKTIIVG